MRCATNLNARFPFRRSPLVCKNHSNLLLHCKKLRYSEKLSWDLNIAVKIKCFSDNVNISLLSPDQFLSFPNSSLSTCIIKFSSFLRLTGVLTERVHTNWETNLIPYSTVVHPTNYYHSNSSEQRNTNHNAASLMTIQLTCQWSHSWCRDKNKLCTHVWTCNQPHLQGQHRHWHNCCMEQCAPIRTNTQRWPAIIVAWRSWSVLKAIKHPLIPNTNNESIPMSNNNLTHPEQSHRTCCNIKYLFVLKRYYPKKISVIIENIIFKNISIAYPSLATQD